MTPEPERPASDLGGLIVRGVAWFLAGQGATLVLGLASAIVVARYLGPHEVGLAVEALVFGSLALVIVDSGFGAALVQRPTLSEEDKSTAFWASIVLGLGLTLVGIGLSWPIASLYGEPRVQPLFAVLSFAFLFTSLSIVQGALLTRELNFRSLEVRTIIATTMSCGTGMVLAVAGAGAWAIIVQDLVITSVGAALLWRASPWRPRATFSTASLKSMVGYASHVFGHNVLNWGTLNLDNFMIGRFLGTAQLGAYSIAFSVIITPAYRIASPVTQVLFPAFSQMRDPDRIARTWMRSIRMVALVVAPSMFGVIAVAPDLVVALFGDQWEDAIPVIQILAPVGLILALTTINFGILKSLARTRLLFRFTVALSVVTVGAFAAGLPWGIEGVAAAYLIATLVMQSVFVVLVTRLVALSPWAWLRSISGVLQASVGMLLVVLGARELLLDTELGTGLRLAALIGIGTLAYVPLVLWRAPEVRAELPELLKRGRRVPPAPVGEGAGTSI